MAHKSIVLGVGGTPSSSGEICSATAPVENGFWGEVCISMHLSRNSVMEMIEVCSCRFLGTPASTN